MSDLTLFAGGGEQSPFDSIKQSRIDGSEFWSARDLMPRATASRAHIGPCGSSSDRMCPHASRGRALWPSVMHPIPVRLRREPLPRRPMSPDHRARSGTSRRCPYRWRSGWPVPCR
ncbi:hypothetical protein DW322_11080 [Rhodococcus rhodnii]|uniref:Uncharacterized protein n=1 Tax=Rhodococcus rhodnii TaxID=38312 RepID=A0A6P2CDM5_9NOCA|nr:hypothetical protein DW322_11080 [Rhodococcus rhodnii]